VRNRREGGRLKTMRSDVNGLSHRPDWILRKIDGQDGSSLFAIWRGSCCALCMLMLKRQWLSLMAYRVFKKRVHCNESRRQIGRRSWRSRHLAQSRRGESIE